MHLIRSFVNMILLSKTAVKVYQKTVHSLDILRLQLQSNSICLWCLHWKSENTLFCEHTICNVCVQIYEDEMLIINCQYYLETYLLCHFRNCTVRLKPFSADKQILAIDEEGICEVISLKILTVIQSIMKTELQIQDLFDLAFDISVDKLHVLISQQVKLKVWQKISLSVSYFYVTCQLLSVFPFLMHWLRNSLKDLEKEWISSTVFISSWEAGTETVITMQTL